MKVFIELTPGFPLLFVFFLLQNTVICISFFPISLFSAVFSYCKIQVCIFFIFLSFPIAKIQVIMHLFFFSYFSLFLLLCIIFFSYFRSVGPATSGIPPPRILSTPPFFAICFHHPTSYPPTPPITPTFLGQRAFAVTSTDPTGAIQIKRVECRKRACNCME